MKQVFKKVYCEKCQKTSFVPEYEDYCTECGSTYIDKGERITKRVKNEKSKYESSGKKKIKILALVLSLILVVGVGTFGAIKLINNHQTQTYYDMFEFELLEDGTYAVAMSQDGSIESNLELPSTYNNVAVTAIKDSAFKNCTSIKQVTIPRSIVSIGNSAFSGCTELTSVVVTSSVEKIGESAFSDCTKLSSIEIPNKITQIEQSTFKNCSTLTTINIPESVVNIGTYAFSDCVAITTVNIPNSVTDIGEYAFYNCSKLTAVTIPTQITTLKASTFENCSALGSVNLNEGLEKIEANAMKNCGGLSNVVIPNTVTTIGESAFSGCTNIINLTVGTNVSNVDANAFYGCEYISLLNYNDSLANWTKITFANEHANPLYYAQQIYTEGQKPTGTLTIPEGVTILSSYALKNCDGLTAIVVPDSVTTIKEYAFKNCSNIGTITIGTGCVDVSNVAFDGCSSLTKAYVPTSAISVLPKANLKEIILVAGSEIPENALNGATELTLLEINKEIGKIGSGLLSESPKITKVTYSGTIEDWCAIEFADITSNPLYYTSNFFIGEESLPSALELGDEVDIITDYAFVNLANLTSIKLSANIENVGSNAFVGCSNVSSAVAPIKALACIPENNLTSLTITSGNKLQASDLARFVKLTEVTIPSSIVEFGENLFANATDLNKVAYDGTLVDWCGIVFEAATSNPLYYTKNVYINNQQIGTKVDIASEVSSLSNYAFVNLNGLTEISIHSAIQSVGENAFYGCSNIKTVELPVSALACIDKAKLEQVTINSGTEIPTSAFASCSNLKTIQLPSSVVSIKSNAFSNCSKLEEIIFDGTVIQWCNIAFENNYSNPMYYTNKLRIDGELLRGEVVIGEGATKIPSYMFKSVTDITKITIADSVEAIGSNAFYGCSGLTAINITKNISTIASDAFIGCTNLETITASNENQAYKAIGNCLINIANKELVLGCKNSSIPNDESVTAIGTNAFYGSTITELIIPSNITHIKRNAFVNCNTLEKVNYLGSLENWCAVNFEYNPMTVAQQLYLNGSEMSGDITVADGVTIIPDYTFKNSTKIKSIILPHSVVEIGSGAFLNCSGVEKITLSNNVNTFGGGIMAGCSSLTTLEGSSSMLNNGTHYSGYKIANGLGFLFSSTTFENSYGVSQKNGYGNYQTWYIPNSLKNIVVTNGSVPTGAFENCSSLESVKIVNGSANSSQTWKGVVNLKTVQLPIATFEYITKDKLETIIFTNGTEVTSSMLSGCYSLKSLTLPATLESFDSWILTWDSLTELIVDENNPNFSFEGGLLFNSNKTTLLGAMTSLTGEVEVPSGVTTIAKNAFYNCTALKKIVLPSTVKTIEQSAFSGCQLDELVMHSGIETIQSSVFGYGSSVAKINYIGSLSDWCKISFADSSSNPLSKAGYLYLNGVVLEEINISEGITQIKPYTFSGLKGVTNVNLPEGVLEICEGAFATSQIQSIALPSTLTKIGKSAFSNCDSLAKVVIPDNVESIGDSAFNDCSALTELTFGSSLKTVGEYAFNCCYYIDRINFTGTLLQWCNIEFGQTNTWFEYELYIGGSKVTSLVIPEEITELSGTAFRGVTSITSVQIPVTVKKIGGGAFSECENISYVDYRGTISDWCKIDFGSGTSNPLMYATSFKANTANGSWDFYNTNITIPSGITEIKPYTFYGFVTLQTITLPSGIQSIGDYAFAWCDSLKSIVIPASVVSIGDSAFYDCRNLESVTFGANSKLTTIGNYAFYRSKVTSITIPYNVNFIGRDVFDYSSLTSAIFENKNGWYYTEYESSTSGTNLTSDFFNDTAAAASMMNSNWRDYYLKRK